MHYINEWGLPLARMRCGASAAAVGTTIVNDVTCPECVAALVATALTPPPPKWSPSLGQMEQAEALVRRGVCKGRSR